MTDDKFYLQAFGAAMTRDEREFLKSIAQDATIVSHPYFVNIGVFHGCSMHCLWAGAPDAMILGVDIDLSQEVERMDLLKGCVFVERDSAVYGRDFEEGIDFLFIDGDHHYKQVEADIKAWIPHVVVGGIVAFHDYSPKQVDLERDPTLHGIKRAVDEWHAANTEDWAEFAHVDSIMGFRRNG